MRPRDALSILVALALSGCILAPIARQESSTVPTEVPSPVATDGPTLAPASEPPIGSTLEPTTEPSVEPTLESTVEPSGAVTPEPTAAAEPTPAAEDSPDASPQPTPVPQPTLDPALYPPPPASFDPSSIPYIDPLWRCSGRGPIGLSAIDGSSYHVIGTGVAARQVAGGRFVIVDTLPSESDGRPNLGLYLKAPGETRRLLVDQVASCGTDLIVSPNGETVYLNRGFLNSYMDVATDLGFWRVPLDGGQPSRMLPPVLGTPGYTIGFYWAAVSPDGRSVARSNWDKFDGELAVTDYYQGRFDLGPVVDLPYMLPLGISADGRVLVRWNQEVRQFNPTTMKFEPKLIDGIRGCGPARRAHDRAGARRGQPGRNHRCGHRRADLMADARRR